MKTLVVYYSYEGNTELIARAISDTFKCDCISIKPVNEMKSKGFAKYVWGGGQVVMKIVPKIEPININLDDYDFILIGSPIWAGTYAPPIRSFIESTNCSNKKIAYFYTHLGGAELAEKRATQVFNKQNTLVSCLGLMEVNNHPDESKAQAIEWVKSIL